MGDPPVGTDYFIKPGYRPNEVRGPSVDTEYWNARRIQRSGYFQYGTYRIARRLLRGVQAARVLDLGCGTGVKAAELLIPHCAYYCGLDQRSAVDYCRKTIAAKHAEFRVEDLESPVSRFDAPFDVIVCADVIEHLAHPERLLRYAAALLAEGGRLIVSTPERDVMHGRDVLVSPNPEHVREWNRAELGAFMRACGLRVLDLRLAPQFRLALTATGSESPEEPIEQSAGVLGLPSGALRAVMTPDAGAARSRSPPCSATRGVAARSHGQAIISLAIAERSRASSRASGDSWIPRRTTRAASACNGITGTTC